MGPSDGQRMTIVGVVEVHRGPDGVWEASDVPVLDTGDLASSDDLASFDACPAPVRIRGAIIVLDVYCASDEHGWILWNQAPVPPA
jgi:hypothetical protein